MLRKYRLILILKSELKKEDKDAFIKTAMGWAGKTDKQKITDLGEKKFAYSIKGAQKGDYVLVEFESDSVSAELESKVRIHDNVLRHLLVRD